MDMAMTINEFRALLVSEQEDRPLVDALRKLTAIEDPEEIAALAEEEGIVWTAWAAV